MKMTPVQIEDAKVILENEASFYKKWCELNINRTYTRFPIVYRNLVKDFLDSHYASDANDRQTLCNYFDIIWAKNGDRVSPTPEVQPVKKEIKMSTFAPSVTIKTVTFLNDQDISKLSKEQLLEALMQVEADKEKLNAIKTDNKFLVARQVELTGTLQKIKELLDKE
jgi:hypothetical protein